MYNGPPLLISEPAGRSCRAPSPTSGVLAFNSKKAFTGTSVILQESYCVVRQGSLALGQQHPAPGLKMLPLNDRCKRSARYQALLFQLLLQTPQKPPLGFTCSPPSRAGRGPSTARPSTALPPVPVEEAGQGAWTMASGKAKLVLP